MPRQVHQDHTSSDLWPATPVFVFFLLCRNFHAVPCGEWEIYLCHWTSLGPCLLAALVPYHALCPCPQCWSSAWSPWFLKRAPSSGPHLSVPAQMVPLFNLQPRSKPGEKYGCQYLPGGAARQGHRVHLFLSVLSALNLREGVCSRVTALSVQAFCVSHWGLEAIEVAEIQPAYSNEHFAKSKLWRLLLWVRLQSRSPITNFDVQCGISHSNLRVAAFREQKHFK